jgi:putative membrane protein
MTTHDHTPHQRAPLLPSDQGEMRTIMGADRTLMAWVRTGLSMISFGFTIYKFLEGAEHKEGGILRHPESPQRVGLILCAIGTLSIVLGTWDYWQTLKDLNRAEHFRLGRPVLFIALVMSVVGVALFLAIAVRLV